MGLEMFLYTNLQPHVLRCCFGDVKLLYNIQNFTILLSNKTESYPRKSHFDVMEAR